MNNVLCLDIETVPQKESWTEVSEITQELFVITKKLLRRNIKSFYNC